MNSHNNPAPSLVAMTSDERRAWLLEKSLSDGVPLEQALRLARQADDWIERGHEAGGPHRGSVNLIIAAVCEASDIKRVHMLGQSRMARLAHPRQLIMLLAHELTGASFPQIGQWIGGRDHTTVMHGIRMARGRLEACGDYRALRDEALDILNRSGARPVDNPVTNGEKSDEAKVTRLYAER